MIRKIIIKDKENWKKLYKGYAYFYKSQINDKILDKEIKAISKSEKWELIRWITRQDNVKAKNLYDKISKKTNWEVYEMLQ